MNKRTRFYNHVSLLFIASCFTRLSLIHVIRGLGSGSLFWKLFAILFVVLHWFSYHPTIKAAVSNCRYILIKCANSLRCTRSTININEIVEGDPSLIIPDVEEINVSALAIDQPMRQQGGSVEIQEYEEINLLPYQSTLELQRNVAYARVGLQYHCLQDAQKTGLQSHPEVLELQENVAYQRPELRECSDFPVYETVS